MRLYYTEVKACYNFHTVQDSPYYRSSCPLLFSYLHTSSLEELNTLQSGDYLWVERLPEPQFVGCITLFPPFSTNMLTLGTTVYCQLHEHV